MYGSAISIKKKRLLYHFYFRSHYLLFYQMTQNLIYIETVKVINSQHRFDVYKVYRELRRDDIAVGKHIFFMEYDLICLLLYQFETNYVKISKKKLYKYKKSLCSKLLPIYHIEYRLRIPLYITLKLKIKVIFQY